MHYNINIQLELDQIAYTVTTSIYPNGNVYVIERIIGDTITGERSYHISPHSTARFFANVVKTINSKTNGYNYIDDDCAGTISLCYPDMIVTADRGLQNRWTRQYLGDVVLRFFADNRIEWDISEKGWQAYRDMVEKRRID